MGIKEVKMLKPGDRVWHRYLGLCMVESLQFESLSVELFGVVVVPITAPGVLRLEEASGMPQGTPMLEHSYRQMKKIK